MWRNVFLVFLVGLLTAVDGLTAGLQHPPRRSPVSMHSIHSIRPSRREVTTVTRRASADDQGAEGGEGDRYSYLKELSPEELKAKVNAGLKDAASAPADSDLSKGALPQDAQELMAVNDIIREKENIIDEVRFGEGRSTSTFTPH